jgi:acyl carrier protein
MLAGGIGAADGIVACGGVPPGSLAGELSELVLTKEIQLTALSDDMIRIRVRELLLGCAPVKTPPDTPDLELVKDLGYNSMALLEAIVTLEGELGFFLINDGITGSISTVAEIQDHAVKLAHEAS